VNGTVVMETIRAGAGCGRSATRMGQGSGDGPQTVARMAVASRLFCLCFGSVFNRGMRGTAVGWECGQSGAELAQGPPVWSRWESGPEGPPCAFAGMLS
jgi:hypothetical protein